MDSANRLLEAAGEIQTFCEQNRWPFCFIGGIAVLHWGEARVRQHLVELLDLKGDSESLLRLETILGGGASMGSSGHRQGPAKHNVE